MGNCMDENSIVKSLKDAGCDQETIDRYCELSKRSCCPTCVRKEQLRLLQQYRKRLLEEIHDRQSKLDCLDYLLYQLKQDLAKEMNEET